MATALLTRPWSKVSVDADTAAAAAEVGTVCLLILHANTFPPPPLLDVVGFMLTMPVPGSAMHVSFQKFSFRKRERERERERERGASACIWRHQAFGTALVKKRVSSYDVTIGLHLSVRGG